MSEEEDYEQVRKRLDMIVLSNCPICHSNFAKAPVHLWPVEFKEKVLDFDVCVGHTLLLAHYLQMTIEEKKEKIFYHYKRMSGEDCYAEMPSFTQALECARYDYVYEMGEPIEIVCGSTVYPIEELAGQQQWERKSYD